MAVSGSTFPQPKLKGFIFTEKLGSGSYATVYKAYRKSTSREVLAIKCVLKSSLTRSSTENLLTEIELLKKLKHENIVELKDFQWDDRYIYLLMEYCTGGDLSKFIQSKRTISEKSAQQFLQQIAKAMQYLRGHNVAHMDLKPQNILLSSSTHPVIKIADFGFAKPLMEGAEMIALRGSPLYMAPEIVCKGHYDARVDLWSIGVIFYECLFGQAPFASSSYKELGKKIWDSKPVQLPYGIDVSDECRSILEGLLRRDPDTRMSFEEFFNHPFIDFEHMPDEDSLPKAVSLVQLAVDSDISGDIQQAISLYCDALRFFMPAVQYEKRMEHKERLREKVTEYMNRAETLKSLLKPAEKSGLSKRSSSGAEILQELLSLCKDKAVVTAALQLISAAEAENEREMYDKAREHYEIALGVLIQYLQDDDSSEEIKHLLRKAIPKWMEKAEQVKMCQSMKKLRLAQVMQHTHIDDTLSAQCCLQ